MSWIRFSERMKSLPLILCGPLLRRVDNTSTTVWIALRKPCKVTLRVYQVSNLSGRVQVQVGTRSTVKLGQHLHVVAVTAVGSLKWSELFVYNLYFNEAGNDTVHVAETEPNLFSADVLAKTESEARKLILYDTSELAPGIATLDLPSFVTLPTDLNQLRLIHGSCRKPHGESQDALQILDLIIRESLGNSANRPHQLFLTGDQIYADDVADALLAILTDAGDTLLGWTEDLPIKGELKKPAELLPGHRQMYIHYKDGGPFTSEYGRSHLLSLGEFYAMYLFVWSSTCWPNDLPSYSDVHGHDLKSDKPTYKALNSYTKEINRLESFRSTLKEVQRALANIPSYMIMDDHEITDDWYLDSAWCEVALNNPLGRRVIGNGLLSYAIFQAWGNTPQQFENGISDERGQKLLKAASEWNGTDSHSALTEIQLRVGLNQLADVKANKKLTHPSGSLDWHYHLPSVNGGPAYEVIVLDSRTWRGFPGTSKDAAALISDKAILERQLVSKSLPPSDGLTVVIAPAPVIGSEFVEKVVQRKHVFRYTTDREVWSHHPETFELLLAELAQRNSHVVILSGDVHYGFSVHMSYWAQRPFDTLPMSTKPYRAAIVQLTASSLKNETSYERSGERFGTHFQHYHGWDPRSTMSPLPINMAGWNVPTTVFRPGRGNISLRKKPALLNIDTFDRKTETVDSKPDWYYRIDYLLAEPRTATPINIPLPENWKEMGMKTYLAGSTEYKKFMAKYAPGQELVGFNNLGEITFVWNKGDDRFVKHQLWWWLESTAQPFPLSKYTVSLRINDLLYPEPLPLPVLPE